MTRGLIIRGSAGYQPLSLWEIFQNVKNQVEPFENENEQGKGEKDAACGGNDALQGWKYIIEWAYLGQ